MVYTLGTAAKAVGLSKATIHRAIKSGAISAFRKENGSYEIQPAELHRVYPPVSAERSVADDVQQSETPAATRDAEREMAIANARMEAELSGLKELLRMHKDQVEDLRSERDRLLGQVEASTKLLTHERSRKARWWQGWRLAS